MKTNNFVASLLLSASLLAGSSYAAKPEMPAMVSNGMLTGTNGMTLYVFDKDAAGSAHGIEQRECCDICVAPCVGEVDATLEQLLFGIEHIKDAA